MDGRAWWAAVSGVAQSDMTETTQQQHDYKYIRIHTYTYLDMAVQHDCDTKAFKQKATFFVLVFTCVV